MIELVAVLAILGILVALALARYWGNRRQAYRAEAQALLQEVKGLEIAYFMDHSNCFTSNIVGLGFVMPGGSHWGFPTPHQMARALFARVPAKGRGRAISAL